MISPEHLPIPLSHKSEPISGFPRAACPTQRACTFPISLSIRSRLYGSQWLQASSMAPNGANGANGAKPMAPGAIGANGARRVFAIGNQLPQWRQTNGANGAEWCQRRPMAPEPLGAIAQWLLEPYNLAVTRIHLVPVRLRSSDINQQQHDLAKSV